MEGDESMNIETTGLILIIIAFILSEIHEKQIWKAVFKEARK